MRGVIGVGARTGRWAVALVAAVTLGGCGTTIEAPGPDTPAGTAAAPPVPGHGPAPLPAPLPPPTDDAASVDAASAVASAAVTAFARPDVDADLWWAELSPLLSPAATTAYASTDPSLVPARAVTGPPRTGESPSSYLATVFVPTDAGEYAVLLVREGGGAPWLVERIMRVPDALVEAPGPPTGEAGA